jgi:hypothetical protein
MSSQKRAQLGATSGDSSPKNTNNKGGNKNVAQGTKQSQTQRSKDGGRNIGRGKSRGGKNASQRPESKSSVPSQSQSLSPVATVPDTNGSGRRNTNDDRDTRSNGSVQRNVLNSKGNEKQKHDTNTSGLSRGKNRGTGNSNSDSRSTLGTADGENITVMRDLHGSITIDALCELWRLLFLDLAAVLVVFYDQYLKDFGLYGMIDEFQSVAACLIRGTAPIAKHKPFVEALRREVTLQIALQLLRFGKRYTPNAEVLGGEDRNKEVLDKFLQRNNRCKMLNRTDLPFWLVSSLRRISTNIFRAYFKGRKMTFRTIDRNFEVDFRHLPHGTTAEGLKSPFEKYVALKAAYGMYPYPYVGGIDMLPINPDPDTPSVMKLVPKDYRGPRIIAMEPLMRTLDQSIMADEWLRVLRTPTFSRFCPAGRVCLNDQRHNQELARRGALDRSVATYDLSNASDSITYHLLEAILPRPLDAEVLNSVSKRIQLPTGKVVTLHIPLTMGSRLTVPGQSHVNWVLLGLCVEIGVSFGLCTWDALDLCAAYNDDITAPSVLDDIVRYIFTRVGYVLNENKSYVGDIPFRESCGKDYYNDTEVTSAYWPRREIDFEHEDLPSLCSLQNKLVLLGAEQASRKVFDYTKKLYKKTPTILLSDVGSKVGLIDLQPSITVEPYVTRARKIHRHDAIYIAFSQRQATGVPMCTITLEPTSSTCVKVPIQWNMYEPIELAVTDVISMIIDYCRIHKHNSCDMVYRDTDAYLMWIKPLTGKSYWTYHKLYALFRDIVDSISHDIVEEVWTRYQYNAVYKVTEYSMVPTYNNTLFSKGNTLVDRKYLAPFKDDLVDDWSKDLWYLNGSRYPDDLCKYLHVTERSDPRKNMVQVGYKAAGTSYTEVGDLGEGFTELPTTN